MEYIPLLIGIFIALITGFVAYLSTKKQAESAEEIDLRKLGKEMREELRGEIKRQNLVIETQKIKIDALEALVDTLRLRLDVLEKSG